MIYLYNSTETDFRYNGKPLPTAYDVTVSNTLNSEYYVMGKYPLDKDKVYKEIVEDRIIKVHTMDGMEPFRIVNVSKQELYVEFEAWPLFYADMRNKLVKPLNLSSASGQTALNSFKNNLLIDTPFDFYSDITDNHDYHTQGKDERENNPKQLYNALDVFKTIVSRWGGELWIRGYDIRVNKRVGTDTEAMLYEKKNITEFVDTTNIEGIVTRLHGKSEWQDEPKEGEEEGQKHSIETTVNSPLINNYSGVVFEKQYTNNAIRTEQALKNWLNLKFTTDNIDKPQRSIEVGTNIVDGMTIGFADTLILKYIKHDTDVRIKVVGYEYDGFANELKHVVLGQPKHTSSSTIGNTITDLVNNVVDPVDRKTTIAMNSADGKSTVFHGTADPNTLNLNTKENDTYFRTNGSEKEIWRFTGTLWELIMDTSDTTKNAREIEAVIEQAQADRTELEEEIGNSLLLAKAHAQSEDARIRGELESEIGGAIALGEQAKQDAIDRANQALQGAKEYAEAEDARIKGELEISIGGAIDLAEQAKSDASSKANQAYKDAVAEADRLAAIRDNGITIEAGQITAGIIDVARLDAVSIVTRGLTANVIKSTHIETSTATIDKLFANEAMINRLTAKTAFINSVKAVEIDAARITSGTINTARLNTTEIVTQGLTANVIKSTHIETSTATIDKLFANDAMVNRLTAKSAFINSVKAVEIDASKITSGTINTARLNAKEIITEGLVANVIKSTHIQADTALFDKLFTSTLATDRLSAQTAWIKNGMFANASIDGAKIQDATIGSAKIANLDVGKISGDTSNFVQSAWNSATGGSVQATGDGIVSTSSEGSTARIQNGVFLSTQPNGATVGYIGHAQTGASSPRFTIQTSLGSHFSVRQRYYNPSGQLANRDTLVMNANETLLDTGNFEIIGGTRRLGFGFRHYISGYSDTTLTLTAHSTLILRARESSVFAISNNGTNNSASLYANLNMQGNTVTNQSDSRLKTEIHTHVESSLEKINQFRFVDFMWIKNGKEDFGLIAQQIQKIDATLIVEGEDGYLGLHNHRLSMMALHAVQELDMKHETVAQVVDSHTKTIHKLQQELSKANRRIEELKERIA